MKRFATKLPNKNAIADVRMNKLHMFIKYAVLGRALENRIFFYKGLFKPRKDLDKVLENSTHQDFFKLYQR